MARTQMGKLAGLSAACLAVLGSGCQETDSGGGSSGASLVTVNEDNAEYLAKAALATSIIVDSIRDSAHFSYLVETMVNCNTAGTVEVTPENVGDRPDTVTSPSGGGAPPPPAADTLLEYSACEEQGYTKDGIAAANGTISNFRLRWLNVDIDHPLIDAGALYGVASYFDGGGATVQRIDGFTVTQGNDAFYVEGEIDSFGAPRIVDLDLQIRVENQGGSSGTAQVTSQGLMGSIRQHFDSGVFSITGEDSSVTVTALGGGNYRLEIDTDGDDVPDVTRDTTL